MSGHREHTTDERSIGDVVGCRRIDGTIGTLDGRIEVELHGHAHRYIVRVETGSGGPRLTELTICSPAGATITPKVLRAVPSRRLAYAAAKWAGRGDGTYAAVFHPPEDGGYVSFHHPHPDAPFVSVEYVTQDELHRPESSTARGKLDDAHLRRVADLVRAAVRSGSPVRDTVAAALGVSKPTVDRRIRTAKDRGFLGEHDIPRHNQPIGGTER